VGAVEGFYRSPGLAVMELTKFKIMHFRAEEGGVNYRNVLENLNFLSALRAIADKLNIIPSIHSR
jgi:hypothetical protein